MNREKKEKRESIFSKLAYIFDKRDKIKIGILMGAILVGSFLELAAVVIFMPFINILANENQIEKTWYLRAVYEGLHFKSHRDFMIVLTAVIIFIYVIKNAYLILEKKYIFKFSYNTQMKLSTRLLGAYMKEPYTFHLNSNIATLQRSLHEDTSRFMQVVMYTLELLAELVVCTVLVLYLLVQSKSITIIVLSFLIAFVGIFLMTTRKYSRKLGLENQGYQGKIFQWMNQALGGIKEIKILERESYFTDQFQGYFTKYAKGLQIARTISIMPKYMVEAVAMTGLLVAIIVKLLFGEADMFYYISQLAAFAVAAMRLLPSVGKINEHATNMLYAFPSVELVYHDLKSIEEYVGR